MDDGGAEATEAMKEQHSRGEGTSCFVKVCVCLRRQRGSPSSMRRPDSSNISPIVQVVSSMDGRLKGAKEEKGESVMLSLLALLCPAGGAGGRVKFLAKQAKQQWNFD